MKLPELLCIIKSVDANKATGLDGISAILLKSAAHIISPSLRNNQRKHFHWYIPRRFKTSKTHSYP